MTIVLLYLLSTATGWLFGGIANWAADNLPDIQSREREPKAGGWSHYMTLWWYLLRRDCPHCGKPRPPRVPVLEIVMVGAFVAASGLFRSEPLTLVVIWTYSAFLLTVLVIDIEQRRVLNIMLAPAAVVICLLSLLPGMPGLRSTLLGGGVGLAVFFVLYVIGRGRLGAGDVKLAGVIGLMTGYPAVWSALVGGVILGAAAALILLLTNRANLKTTMAYAPYLVVGAIITIWTSMGAL